MGGRNERAKTERKVQEEEPKTAESVFRSEPKGKPIYFSCAGRPRDLKKSEICITLRIHKGGEPCHRKACLNP